MKKFSSIQIGDQVFAEKGGTEFGAVRKVAADRSEIIVYVENAGDFAVPFEAIAASHDGKVILSLPALDPEMKQAIARAHQNEEPAAEEAARPSAPPG